MYIIPCQLKKLHVQKQEGLTSYFKVAISNNLFLPFWNSFRESFWRRGSRRRGCNITDRSTWAQDNTAPTHYILWWTNWAVGKDFWEDSLPWRFHAWKACTGCWSFWGKNSGSKAIAVNAGKGLKKGLQCLYFCHLTKLGSSITVQEKLWLINPWMIIRNVQPKCH